MKKILAAIVSATVLIGVWGISAASAHISFQAAKQNAKAQAMKTCDHDSNCEKWGFNDCRKHDDGGSCWVYNFQFTPKSGRFTCVERAFWHHPDSRTRILEKFDCSINGWKYIHGYSG